MGPEGKRRGRRRGGEGEWRGGGGKIGGGGGAAWIGFQLTSVIGQHDELRSGWVHGSPQMSTGT